MTVDTLLNGSCTDAVKFCLRVISINYLVEVRKDNNVKAKQKHLKLI